MARILGIVLIVIIVVVLLIWSGFLNLEPEAERVIDETQGGVGEVVEEPGNAIDDIDEEPDVVE